MNIEAGSHGGKTAWHCTDENSDSITLVYAELGVWDAYTGGDYYSTYEGANLEAVAAEALADMAV